MVRSKKQYPRPGRGSGVEKFRPGEKSALLSEVPAGREVTVAALEGGRGLCSRLAALGVLPGSRIKVSCNLGGPVVVEVKGSRVSIGRGMARKVLVRPGAEIRSDKRIGE